MQSARLRSVIIAIAMIANLAGCTSTTLDGSWTSPAFAGKRIDAPVMVVGLARDDTLRRIYEDEMVARLVARGTRATQSHALVPGSLGSDAHEPSEVAHGFADAATMVESQGFRPGRDPHDFWVRQR